MSIKTALTTLLEIEHPNLLAPMAGIAGGALASAVTIAGGLGIVGGGYGVAEWLDQEFSEAGNARIGCGFITWSLAKNPALLDRVLAHAPAALMLSFGAVAPFAASVHAAGIPLICQVQSMRHAREAVNAGADIIVAQGAEAGGHGSRRATFTLVPEIADYLAAAAPRTVLAAAGGVADGRGLAAALMLGADGVLIGSRFWASREAAVPASFQAAAAAADGDATLRTSVVDIVRGKDWPQEFTARVMNNRFVRDWHGREAALAAPNHAATELGRYTRGWESGDAENTGVFVGEAAGLIHDVLPAGDIVRGIVAQAESLLARRWA
jgi:nitronate monooxygenase